MSLALISRKTLCHISPIGYHYSTLITALSEPVTALLRPIRVRRNLNLSNLCTRHYSSRLVRDRSTYLSLKQMTLETALASLAGYKIEPKGALLHGQTTTEPASWKSAIQESPDHSAVVPKEYKLTKTLVFKPKTAKTATPTPLILIASEDTDTKATNALGKKLDLKELRLATDDLIREFFGAEKSSCAFVPRYPLLIDLY